MKIRISAIILLAAVLFAAAGVSRARGTVEYDPKTNYMQEMLRTLKAGEENAFETGAVLENLRNMKIEGEGLPEQKTDYFTVFQTAEEVLQIIETGETAGGYSEEDLYWLSRVINAEAGGSWMPDWVQQGVGSVVLNRVESGRYPGTIQEVIFQTGQYACTTNGSIYEEPAEKAVENARYLLENGATLPEGVLGQSEFIQGEVHSSYEDPYLATTTYFCYM